ncbi:hypothetical protein BDZ90DRAFT_228196 [Jaminaea rosea]|uniref:EF-hand domain-containing protein n=1 Tax=Jaminaea rosea TaxID=1569628 RepID=A0A316URT8_9BASI|nr:hypothetical protein BDZ90DRAFT_228196 [Jaminaea rosea]PWN25845.1 hypothetical protein BDZ90DRAFT_228196 [Jaminaea rosea]
MASRGMVPPTPTTPSMYHSDKQECEDGDDDASESTPFARDVESVPPPYSDDPNATPWWQRARRPSLWRRRHDSGFGLGRGSLRDFSLRRASSSTLRVGASRPVTLLLGLLVLLCGAIFLMLLEQRHLNADGDTGGRTIFFWPTGSDSSKSTAAKGSLGASGQPVMQLARRPQTMQMHEPFLAEDAKYLDAWVARGEILPGLDLSQQNTIDGLWFWVNGSDPRHHAARNFYALDPYRANVAEPRSSDAQGHALARRDDTLKLQNSENRFREHDELRYSMRSAKNALGDSLRTSHLITTDFWASGKPEMNALADATAANVAPSVEPVRATSGAQVAFVPGSGRSDVLEIEAGLMRYGQLPQWLDVDAPGVMVGQASRQQDVEEGAAPPKIKVHHDWQVTADLHSVDPITQSRPEPLSEAETLAHKLRVLPTFNSLAAEASLGLLVPGLGENFFYSNDDHFLGNRDLSVSDFTSPLYGTVMHINRFFVIGPYEHPPIMKGELPSMRYSAYLLAQRFGKRDRHYIIHVQKVHSRPLVDEARMLWGDQFARTVGRRFRGDGQGANSHLLSYNLQIERHREALLWSWFVAKLDVDGDGKYSTDELKGALFDLGYDADETDYKPIWLQDNIPIHTPQRDSMLRKNVNETFDASLFPRPGASTYQFSSQDGYALAGVRFDKVSGHQFPTFHTEPGTKEHDLHQPAAIMNWRVCWPFDKAYDPIALFRHMAFENTACGDFLLTYLVARSGKKGLDVFLPSADTRFPAVATPVQADQTTPHLPLDSRWDDCDFSLSSVARNTGSSLASRRIFATRLIQRYAYTIAGAPLDFQMLKEPKGAKRILDSLKRRQHNLAFIGVNDDVIPGKGEEETWSLFQQWMEEMWPTKTAALDFELPR